MAYLGVKPAGITSATEAEIAGDLTVDTNTLIVDSANNKVGIGTTSPDHTLTVSASSAPVFEMEQTSGGPFKANLVLNGNDLEVRGSSGTIEFYNGNADGASSTERMRIDSSGNVLIGTTATNSGYTTNNTGVRITSSGPNIISTGGGDYGLVLNKTVAQSGSTSYQVNFRNADTNVGGIFTNGSSTTYATTSDHRLKENVVDMSGAIDRVKALSPKRFNFIVEPDVTVDGFLAHEAQTVVPEAVHGTHNEVDDDGNAVMQGIDQSKLMPLLTGALQEAIAKIETLETEMTALKARVTALEDA